MRQAAGHTTFPKSRPVPPMVCAVPCVSRPAPSTASTARTITSGSTAGLRRSPPPLIASTLLVPGYVDEAEVAPLARFIAGLNPDIPYSLLAFYPRFYLQDLPATSRAQAERCRATAEAAGLRRVHLGNAHLLTAS